MAKVRPLWLCPRCGATVKHADRHRDRDGKLSRHCGCGIAINWRLTPEQLEAHKRQNIIELKRKYRRQAGARLRTEIHAAAQAKREAADKAKALRLAKPQLHDAHVRRYVSVISSRKSSAKRYAANPQEQSARASRYKQALPDAYVIQNLKIMGIMPETVTPELIELKRESMQYRRLAKEIKTTLKTNWKAEHETITKHP
jgi:hypothetical protein